MKIKYRFLIHIIVPVILGGLSVQRCRADGNYHLEKQISVSWGGGCDSLAMDEMAHRLYIIDGSAIEVVDPDKQQLIAEMTNSPGISGCVLSPQFRRGFFGNPQDSEIGIFNMSRQQMVKPFSAKKGLDSIVYGSNRGLLYAFNRGDQSVAIFEADDGDYVTTIKLPGTPGVAAVDQKTGRVYCCLDDKDMVVVIDPRTRKIIGQWEILPKAGASAIAVDPPRQRVFVACGDQTVVMINSMNGRIASATAVKGPIYGMVFDPFGKYLLISDGNSLDVVNEYTPQELHLIQNIPLPQGGQAMALDSSTHKIYLVTRDVRKSAGPSPGAATSHTLFVYGP